MHRLFAALGVVLVSIATVSLVAVYGLAISSAIDTYEAAEREYAELQCLGDIILAEVPAGAVVFLADWSGSEHGHWAKNMYWSERITELTYPERPLANEASGADVIVRLIQDDEEPCDGFGIEVMQP